MVVPVCEQVTGHEWITGDCPVVVGMSTGSYRLLIVRCAQFHRSSPDGISIRYNLGVPASIYIRPGVWCPLVSTHTV